MAALPSSKSLILVVEDDAAIRDFLRTALTNAGYRLAEAITGEEALDRAARKPPELVILDLGLPDVDGQLVLQKLREWFKAPIIVLSARNQESQKVMALDSGADDYLTKPFGTAELLARIRTALRHADGAASGSLPVFEIEQLKVDLAAHRVFVRGDEVHLTPIEYSLLSALIRQAGKVLTHRQLLTEIWGPERTQDTHYLRVFMAALRRKIEADSAQPRYLLTEQGVGYRFQTE
jgi:two-component system, OmpR family, KDP operon response regulator KdpE